MDHDDICKFKKAPEVKVEPTIVQQSPYDLVVSITGQMYPRYERFDSVSLLESEMIIEWW